VRQNVAGATQNQAFNALLFFYLEAHKHKQFGIIRIIRNSRLVTDLNRFIRLGRSIRYDPLAVQRALQKLSVNEIA
jgi:hypothetical protein